MAIYDATIKKELASTEKTVSQRAYRAISKFAEDLKIEEGLTDFRIEFYIVRLRNIARIMGSSFISPKQDDVRKAITELRDKKINRLGEKKIGLSERTIEDYKQAMKKFYRRTFSKEEYETTLGWLKIRNNVNRLKKSEDMITEGEIQAIIQNAMNDRDKALFATLYDSGCRVSELLTLKIKDCKFDDYGAKLHVTGKTGERNVRIVGDSVPYLRDWIRVHPDGNNADAWLFVGIAGNAYRRQLTYEEMRSAMRKSVRRAGITRRIHPHLFRHSRASILAMTTPEAPLEAQMGWKHGSKMTGTYVHLTGTATDEAILRSYGKEVKTAIKVAVPKKCPRCGNENPSNASICRNCWLPLTLEAINELKEKQDHIEQVLVDRKEISPQVQAIIDALPEFEKTGLLSTIVEGILKEREKNKS